VVVNGLIQKEQVGTDAASCQEPRQDAGDHMQEIWQIFDDQVRAIVPLFETEVKGPSC